MTITLDGPNTVTIDNVESYRLIKGTKVDVPGLRSYVGDVAWGGNWFFLVQEHGETLTVANVERLTDVTWRIRQALTANLEAFIRMYAPHAAWEDTELFPVFRQLYSEPELDRLGDRFEDQEHKLLGGGGFEGSLKDVGDLEKALGIHDLSKFTPKAA